MSIYPISSSRRYHRGESDRPSFAEYELRGRIAAIIEQCGLKKAQVRVNLVNNPDGNYCQGIYGLNASITLNRELATVDPAAFQSILKHEIGHLSNDDCCRGLIYPITFQFVGSILLVSGSMPLVISLALPLAGSLALAAIIPASVAALVTIIVVDPYFSRYCEGQADDFAIEHSSDDELKGFIRFEKYYQLVRYMKSHQLRDVIANGKGLLLDKDVAHEEFNLFSTHPSSSSRIDKALQELERRGVSYEDDYEERRKIREILDLDYKQRASWKNTSKNEWEEYLSELPYL